MAFRTNGPSTSLSNRSVVRTWDGLPPPVPLVWYSMSPASLRVIRTSFGRDPRPILTPLQASAQSRIAFAGTQPFGSKAQSPSTKAT